MTKRHHQHTSSGEAVSPRRRPFWTLGILGLTLVGLLALFHPPTHAEEEKKSAPAAGPPPGMPVEAAPVEVAPVKREISAVGTLQSAESVVMTAEIPGLVSKIAFEEGDQVKTGQVLVRLDDSVLKAELDRTAARLDLSRANYKRAELLLQDNAIAERERDEAYAQWKLDEANLRLAQANLDKTTIRAPFTGRLGLRKVSPGSYLRPGDPIVSLDAIDPVKADFRVPEVFAGQVQPGQSLEVIVDALPGRSFAGKVIAVAPQIDAQGRSMLVRARVENGQKLLSPGMFARVSLALETRAEALLIPEEALIAQGSQPLVFKVVEGKVEAAPVKTGIRTKGKVEILEGLAAGETVITAGHIKVRPGMPVTVLPTTAQAPSAQKQES